MADVHPLALRQGARALLDLLRRIREVSDATCTLLDDDDQLVDDLDHRDYTGMMALLAESLQRNVCHAEQQHREGYLRAMTDLLCIVADGCGLDLELDDWDPIRNTRRAFDSRAAAS